MPLKKQRCCPSAEEHPLKTILRDSTLGEKPEAGNSGMQRSATNHTGDRSVLEPILAMELPEKTVT